jgi:hypothetical protein
MESKQGSGSYRKAKKALVRRIVVDEYLTKELIRLLIAPLADGVEEITNSETNWETEQEVKVTPKNLLKRLDLKNKNLQSRVLKEIMGNSWNSEANKKKEQPLKLMIWRGLEEGQVFIDGKFEVVGKRYEPEAIKAGEGPRDFLRIDRIPLVKEKAKKLYSAVLRGKEVTDA